MRGRLRMASPLLRNHRSAPNAAYLGVSVTKMKQLVILFIVLQCSSAYAGGYEPWVVDEYFFHVPNEQRSYTFTPDRWSSPEIVLFDKGCKFPNNLFGVNADGKPQFQFEWEITWKVIRNNEAIESGTLEPKAAWMSDTKFECLKSISFSSFKSIARELFPGEVTIEITVHKVDSRYAHALQDVTFGIRNSPVP